MPFSTTHAFLHRAAILFLAVPGLTHLFPVPALATEPYAPTVLRENTDGTWKLDGDYLGGSGLFILDAKDQTRLFMWIKNALPKADFDKYVHQSTARKGTS
jgi:hypothetical protein